MKRRYQECNYLEKFYRRRYYAYIPFYFLYYQYLVPFKVIDDISDKEYNPKGKNLWKLLIGIAQGNMQWYYTMDEVKDRFKRRP